MIQIASSAADAAREDVREDRDEERIEITNAKKMTIDQTSRNG